MSALPLSRRELLRAASITLGLAAGLGLTTPALAASMGPAFLIDSRLPEAAALAARARQVGGLLADAGGEMVRLLLGPHGEALIAASTLIGLSTYSDLVLARDVLRSRGRPLQGAIALPLAGHDAPAPLLGLLHSACRRRCGSQATSHLWLA